MIPTISVIIPSSRPVQVRETINGIITQDVGTDFFEVIVVSPYTIDDNFENLIQIKTIRTNSLFPPGKMRNIGAAAARGTYLTFIDDDCVPPSHWLSTFLQIFQEEANLAVAGCRVVSSNKGFWCRAADYALFGACQYFSRKKIGLGAGATMFKRSCFEKANGFDEGLRASEDWDISLKLQKLGWDCIFDPQVEVIHDHKCDSLSLILKKSYAYGIGSRLVIQNRYRNQMSWLAKLAVTMGTPWFYWLLILPYSFLVCALKGASFIRHDKNVIMYFPVMLISQIFYHIGVLNGLIQERSSLNNANVVK